MKKYSPISVAYLTVLIASTANSAEVLLDTDTSWDGGTFAYPTGKAQITAVTIHLEPGQDLPFHCHPVPTMGYVQHGSLDVETASGDKQRFEEGDAVVEVMNTLHRGRAVGGPVDIVVFYAGAEGVPTTVLPDTEEAKEWPCGMQNG